MRKLPLSSVIAPAVSALLTVLLLAASVAQKEPVTSTQADVSAAIIPVQAAATMPAADDEPPVLELPVHAAPRLLPIADQAAFTPRHRVLADRVLRALPASCRENLQNLYIQYTGAKQRGLGGKTTIIIDGSVNDAEFVALLVHECGHVIHANMQGTPTLPTSAFADGKDIFYTDSPAVSFFLISWMTENVLRKNAQSTDFASGYAKSDAFEDFAETFALYVLHRQAFERLAEHDESLRAKLAWMEAYLPLPQDVLGESTYLAGKKVPWDVTKLPFRMATNVALR